jgi:hypothetical protein
LVVFGSLPLPSGSSRHLTTGRAVNLAGDRGRLIAGKKDEDWTEFGGRGGRSKRVSAPNSFTLSLGAGWRE